MPRRLARFVEHEPYNRAGMFGEHVIRRFENLLGRTIWEFPRESADPRFFVIGHVRAGETGGSAPVLAAAMRERLIVFGEMLTPDGAEPAGVALALEAPTREAAAALVTGALDERFDVELHDWEFGGRR